MVPCFVCIPTSLELGKNSFFRARQKIILTRVRALPIPPPRLLAISLNTRDKLFNSHAKLFHAVIANGSLVEVAVSTCSLLPFASGGI